MTIAPTAAVPESPVLAALLPILCCPRDRGELTLEPAGARDLNGATLLRCGVCDAAYPIVRGIPRFVPSDDYAGNFSLEWTFHRKTQLDTETDRISEDTFRIKTGLTPDDVRGKLVLDVGCGMGRFANVIVKWGGRVVGIDLSLAVESAQSNLGGTRQFQALQASVFNLPFKLESFDLIYSLGVLHHTPDCKKAFMALPPLLKRGGNIAIWVYSSHTFPDCGVDEIRDRAIRRFTTRMNSRTLHNICRVLCLVRPRWRAFWHMLLPGFIYHAIPRLHSYKSYDWRVLDTFDWYSPVYQSKHSYPEVCEWFREAGLGDIRPLRFEVAVRGMKGNAR